MTVVYEDNHIIIVNKTASEIVQGDKMSYQGRFEVWLCPFQSGWKYLPACTSYQFCASGI